MNIAIDIRCLLDKQYSGVPGYTYNLLKNLFKIDSKNQYFLFSNSSKISADDIDQIKELKNFNNVKLVSFAFPNKILNFSLRFFKYPKIDKLIEKKIGKKIDLLFMPNPNFSAWSANCKMVLTIHDLSFELYPEFFAGKPTFGLAYIRGRFWHRYVDIKGLCQKADKIIAVSESTRQNLVDVYGVDGEKIRVVYEGFDFDEKNWNDNICGAKNPQPPLSGGLSELPTSSISSRTISELPTNLVSSGWAGVRTSPPDKGGWGVFLGVNNYIKNKYNLPEKYILFLATLEPRKNIDSLILAYEKIVSGDDYPDLVIAGKKGWLYHSLFALAEKSRFKHKIKFIGYVDEADKPALYQMASLFVFPAFYEGFGLPPLEAMSCGCPVIVSNSSSLPEVVGDAGLLIDPYDINSLAEAMKEVLSDEELRKNMIKKGLKRSEMFSWEKATGESLGVFEGVL